MWHKLLSIPNLKFQLIAFIISMFGLYYNIKKRKCGFLIWTVGNMMWVYMNIKNNIIFGAFLFIAYSVTNIIGYFSWRKDDINKP